MVKKSTGVKSAKELDGATICVQPGTSTELAINDYFRINHMKFTPVLIQDYAEIQNAFFSGRCDAYSTDGSGLATTRFAQGAKADDYVILPEVISKEPLGAMVRKGDDKWFDMVRWTFIALLTAEEDGVTSKNVDEMLKSTTPGIRRLLGVDGDMGKALGVDNKWAYNAIKQVGNFAEIWDRNIAPMGVPRGLNNLWTKGGLQYPPPIR
jgi:general L-amino acid transport system substrate-binding protein